MCGHDPVMIMLYSGWPISQVPLQILINTKEASRLSLCRFRQHSQVPESKHASLYNEPSILVMLRTQGQSGRIEKLISVIASKSFYLYTSGPKKGSILEFLSRRCLYNCTLGYIMLESFATSNIHSRTEERYTAW